MPPDASSRSRTYLPKIWGNTCPIHRTALLGASLVLSSVTGCKTLPGEERVHPIRAHYLPGCTPSGTAAGSLDLQALGDFDPSGDTFETFDDPAVKDAPLIVPLGTRAVVVTATAGASTFHGVGTENGESEIDVALFPEGSACPLTDPGAAYPGTGGGRAMGVSGDGRLLLIVGGEDDGDQSGTGASAITVDLTTGERGAVSAENGPRTFRAGATVTPFGGELLVAGGYDPDPKSKEPLGSADVFDVAASAFERSRIELERPRAHHGAAVLATGETLLVGGVDSSGHGLRRLEAISPTTRSYLISGFAELRSARSDPTVLRLSDDRILVAGGTDPDNQGAVVDIVEWLRADASDVVATLALSSGPQQATQGRAFSPMPGGGVLVVGGCTAAAVSNCVPCGSGSGCASSSVQWITPEGTVQDLQRLDTPVSAPVLVPGAEGRPILFGDPTSEMAGTLPVLVFDPFEARFRQDEAWTVAPTAAAKAFIAVDSGLLAWLDVVNEHGVVEGFRHGTRNPLTPSPSPLLSVDLEGIALDRSPGGLYQGDARTVSLASDARLVVTDTTYGDVHLVVTRGGGPAPLVVLGDRTYGDRSCRFPPSSADAALPLRVDRVGDRVTLSARTETVACAGPTGRVAVALGAGAEPTTLSSITVRRSAGP